MTKQSTVNLHNEDQLQKEHDIWADNRAEIMTQRVEQMVKANGLARLPINGMRDMKIERFVVKKLKERGYTVKQFTGHHDPENPSLNLEHKILVTK